ncbi:MAG: shikimate kinase [Actinomycetota bacterium]
MATANVILTGFMGTGKTTVGRLLADRLGLGFVDTDAVIEERHGPIPEIFAEEGEAGFRAIERRVAGELAERDGLVVATGGRMMLDPDNQASLGATGPVFCLVADPGEILRRVEADPSPVGRPLLAGDEPAVRLTGLLAERAPLYARFEQVATDGRTPEEVADELADRIGDASA